MASSMKKTNVGDKNVESKQLLYPDKFGQSYQEDRLRIVGKANAQDCLQTYSLPQSSVLSQIKSFLPRLSNANLKLAADIEKDPQKADKINIECVEDDAEGKHIEMNLSMIPTVDSGESEPVSDDSSDEDDGVMEEEQQENDASAGGGSSVSGESKSDEQSDLMKLKLLTKISRKKEKAGIEVIDNNSSSCQKEVANG